MQTRKSVTPLLVGLIAVVGLLCVQPPAMAQRLQALFSVDNALGENDGLPGTAVANPLPPDSNPFNTSHIYHTNCGGMNSHRMTDVWYGLNWLDDLDAVSGGWDNLERLYWFSVEDAVGAVEGRPGSAVAFEALNDGLPAVPPGDRAVQGDLFVSVGGSGTNWLWQDEALLGLDNDNPPTPPDDDIDALELTGGPGIYFSVDRTSNLGAADIYASQWDNANMLWAPAPSMGLHAACDNLDALSMFDADGWSWWQTAQILQANPATDWALFSLYPGSASLGLVGPGQFFWWNNWMNGPPVTDAFTGALRSPSPGDILITNFTGQFWLWEDATDIGLNYQDNLDALDVTPEVGTWALLLVTGAFGGWIKRRRKED